MSWQGHLLWRIYSTTAHNDQEISCSEQQGHIPDRGHKTQGESLENALIMIVVSQ